jgi:CHAD domain-containing protein
MTALIPTARIGFALGPAIRQELTQAAAALADADPTRAVHQGRVRLKRARALARLAAPSLDGPARAFNAAARTVLARLSAARDLDALEACARGLMHRARAAQAEGLALLIRHIAHTRAAMPAPNITDALDGVAGLAGACAEWPVLNESAVRLGVARMTRRAGRSFLRALDRTNEERRHDWRKREKDRAYAIELLGLAWPSGVKRRRRRAKRLATALGAERDVLLLRAYARTLAGEDRAKVKPALRLLTRQHRRLAAQADRLGRALHRGEA